LKPFNPSSLAFKIREKNNITLCAVKLIILPCLCVIEFLWWFPRNGLKIKLALTRVHDFTRWIILKYSRAFSKAHKVFMSRQECLLTFMYAAALCETYHNSLSLFTFSLSCKLSNPIEQVSKSNYNLISFNLSSLKTFSISLRDYRCVQLKS
jgi:hypothetical protein